MPTLSRAARTLAVIGVWCLQLVAQRQLGAQSQPPRPPSPVSGPSAAAPTQPGPGDREPLTLDRALALARTNSLQFRTSQTTARLATEDRVQARAAMFPSLTGFGQYIYTQPNGTPSGIFVANDGPDVYNAWGTAHADLFAPGRWADYHAASAAEAVARARLEVAARGLTQTVVQAYYAAVAADRKLTTARDSLADAQQFLNITQRQEQGGEVAHSDVVKAQLQVAARERDAREATLAGLKNRMLLAVLVFADFRDAFELVDDLETLPVLPPADQVATAASQDSPDVKAAEAAVQQQSSGVTSARSGYLPTISFDYWYGIDANQFAIYNPLHQRLLGSVAAAQMTIPLWNWGATQSKLRQAELRLEQARVEAATTRRELLANVRSYYAEAQTALAEVDSLRTSVALATDSLRLTTLRYQAGEVSVLEVVDAQTTLVEARNAYDDGLARYRVALATLQTLTGSL